MRRDSLFERATTAAAAAAAAVAAAIAPASAAQPFAKLLNRKSLKYAARYLTNHCITRRNDRCDRTAAPAAVVTAAAIAPAATSEPFATLINRQPMKYAASYSINYCNTRRDSLCDRTTTATAAAAEPLALPTNRHALKYAARGLTNHCYLRLNRLFERITITVAVATASAAEPLALHAFPFRVLDPYVSSIHPCTACYVVHAHAAGDWQSKRRC